MLSLPAAAILARASTEDAVMPSQHPYLSSRTNSCKVFPLGRSAVAALLAGVLACSDQSPTSPPNAGRPGPEAASPAALADPGDELRTITAANPSSCQATDGIAFDGENLLITCRDDLSIDVVSPVNGSLVRSFTVTGIPAQLQTDPGGFGDPLTGFGAATYDAGEDLLYVDLAYGVRSVCIGATPNCDALTIAVNPATGAFIAGAGAFGLTLRANGHFNLAFDGITGDLWFGTGRVIQFYTPPTTAGDGYTLSDERFNNQAGSPDGIQGIAVGGDNFYLSNGTGREIHEAALRGLSFDAPETEVEARTNLLTATSFDVSNLTCDNHTFAEDDEGDRDGVIWAQHGFTRTFTAYAIALGDCVFGGGGPPANLAPVAIEEGDDNIEADVGEEIDFDGTPSFDREGDTPLTYAWDFDDDEDATGPTVSHAFSAPGTYDVTLSVTDPLGQTGTTVVQVQVAQDEPRPPTATIEGPDEGNVGQALTYTTSATDPNGDALTCRINWGDGTAEAEVPCDGTLSHTYTQTGEFVIFFTARDPGGLVAEARLRVAIAGNQAPTPTIDGPDEGDVGDELSFTTDASDPDDPESSLECAINWGDGSGFIELSSCDAGATHTFEDDGQFVIELRATDPQGASNTDSHAITIRGNQAPTATLEGPEEGDVGEELTYTTSATDPDGDELTCRINWGDSSPETEVDCDGTLSHTYAQAGSFLIFLTARDPGGLVAEARLRVNIGELTACSPGTGAAPVIQSLEMFPRQAAIAAGVDFGTGPLVAEILRWSFRDPDCGPWRVQIDWGDGEESDFTMAPNLEPGLYNTYHAYEASGRYTIALTMTDAAGRASETRRIDLDVDVETGATASQRPALPIAGAYVRPGVP
jgi:PKD repeat protein